MCKKADELFRLIYVETTDDNGLGILAKISILTVLWYCIS